MTAQVPVVATDKYIHLVINDLAPFWCKAKNRLCDIKKVSPIH